MNYDNYIIIFTLIIGLTSVNSRDRVKKRQTCENTQATNANRTYELDRLIFQQSWTPTLCYELSKKKSWNHTSSMCNDNKWLISGLWPSLKQNIGPAFCNCSVEFDALELSPIITYLEAKWVNIYNNHTFMKNQWMKHGTCGAKIDGINNQLDYFNKSLELFDKFSMHNFFTNWTINRGGKYPTELIEDSFKTMLGKKIQLRCILNRTTKEFYLAGVRLCFDLTFNVIDCVGNKKKVSKQLSKK